MRKLGTKIVLILSILSFSVTMGLTIFMSKIDQQTESSTTLYTATVNYVDVESTGKYVFTEIHINEYDTYLLITTSISKRIATDQIKALKKGQVIVFRIENIKVEQMNEVEFINIVSLKTASNNILSLDEYNNYMNSAAYPARVASIVLSLAFLLLSIFCCLRIRKQGQGQGDGSFVSSEE